MKTKFVSFFIALFLVYFLTQTSAFAGAWTVAQYKVWAELYTKFAWSKWDYNEKSEKVRKSNDARSWSWEMEPKFEYGVTDWLNALFSFSYIEAHYKEYARPPANGPYSVMNNGVKSITYGAKWRLAKEPVVASVQGKIYQYTFYDNPYGNGSVEGQPGIGRGDDAFELRGLLGKTFDLPLIVNDIQLPCYVGLESGYRWRNRDVANDIPFFAEFGFWPYKWLLLKAEIDGYKAHPGTGIAQSYAIWRVGMVWQVFGVSTTRKNQAFNFEVQYGQTFWGKGGSGDTDVQGSVVNNGQEIVFKLQTLF